MNFAHDLDAPNPPAGDHPAVLVVQSANRGWILATLPPALILLAALAITSHQLRPDPATYAPLGPASVEGPRVALAPTPELAPAVVSVRGVQSSSADHPAITEPSPSPVPETEPVQANSDGGSPPTEEPAARVSLLDTSEINAPPASRPATAPDANASQIVWDDIQDEAREAREKKQEAEALRGQVFARQESERRDQLLRRRLVAANDRSQFLSDLSALLRKHGRKAGPYINELVGLYGRSTPPEMLEAGKKLNRQLNAANASIQQRITAYRRLGLPETCILDEVAQQYEPAIGTRKGPRNREEVLYFASRLLLNTPLESSRPAATAAPR